jgi:S-adenosylmethionine-dependent methyltransferase
MTTSLQTVQSYYDRDPEHEWLRLERGRFEMPVTMHYLQRYVRSPCSVLDVGGGPGRYAIALARLGHRVDLFDLSPECIAFARRKAKELDVGLNGFHTGTCTDLGRFPNESFDAVLCMGPLYHLTDPADRDRAILESLRVLKRSGVLVAAFLSSYAHVFDLVCIDMNSIRDLDPQALAEKCRSTSFTNDPFVFTDSFYIEPFEVEPLMGSYPLRQLAIIGAQGLTGQSQAAIARAEPKVLEKWLDLAIATAQTKGAIGSSIHIAYYGQKV